VLTSRLGETGPESTSQIFKGARLSENAWPGRVMQKTEISQMNLTVATTSKLPCLPQMTKLGEVNPHTQCMVYFIIEYLFNISTYHQFSQNHIIDARMGINKKIKSQFQTCRDFHICISQNPKPIKP